MAEYTYINTETIPRLSSRLITFSQIPFTSYHSAHLRELTLHTGLLHTPNNNQHQNATEHRKHLAQPYPTINSYITISTTTITVIAVYKLRKSMRRTPPRQHRHIPNNAHSSPERLCPPRLDLNGRRGSPPLPRICPPSRSQSSKAMGPQISLQQAHLGNAERPRSRILSPVQRLFEPGAGESGNGE